MMQQAVFNTAQDRVYVERCMQVIQRTLTWQVWRDLNPRYT